jgi:Rps23 Pro-64 3,4-dihydroxylase Tpa1-like proline 4-hydroxylase
MSDHAALATWIQPQHLDGDSLRSYHKEFSQLPARAVVLQNFLVDRTADRLARFLAEEASFRREYGLYSAEGEISQETWQAAPEKDRFFRLSRLASIPDQFRLSPNTLAYLRFRQTFQRPEYKAFFEDLCGFPLGASDDFGVHCMTVGDFLRPHSDNNRNRRIALVIYLSPNWQPIFGGALRIVDGHGAVTVVEPVYNSMVVFDVLADTEHFVEPIAPSAGDNQRLTIGGWYHQPD